MQVKKFEAKTMKEALEMVKNQLGPDAIILGAKDNNKGFGLLGTASVEVTAAISENKLKARQFAESRLRVEDKDRFRKSTAQQQKKFIEQSISRYRQPEHADIQSKRNPTSTQYIDIEDDQQPKKSGTRVDELLRRMDSRPTFVEPQPPPNAAAKKRIQDAARSAAEVFKNTVQEDARFSQQVRSQSDDEVRKLKQEIEFLRQTVTQMNQVTSAGTHPGADYGLPYDLSFAFERLTAAGLMRENAAAILHAAQKEIPVLSLKNRNLVEAWVANRILRDTQVIENPFGGRVHLFTGNSGQGKTSTAVKFAGQLVIQHRKKVALLTADTMKVGGTDQLKIFSQILNAGFGVIRELGDWEKALQDFQAADVIVVDYPGLSLKTPEEVDRLRRLLPPAGTQSRVHFVQSVCAKDGDAIETAKRYAAFGASDITATHLDESLNHGIIHNLQKAVGLPLHAFGVGPRIPDDFEPATRERVLDLIFKISKQNLPENDHFERSR